MKYINAQIMADIEGYELTDNLGEILLLESPGYIVVDQLIVESIALQPNITTINSKVAAAVKVYEGSIEKELLIMRSGDIFAGEV